MIQFIHTADIHFGVENYGTIDPKIGIHSRLLDFEQALNACIDVAITRNVDFFLFCGDAYKTAHPTPTQQRLLLQCLLRLHKAHIPIVLIIGNHDNPLSFGKTHALDVFGAMPLDGFHVIAQPTSFMLTTKSGPIQIVGIPWPTRNTLALNNQHFFKHAESITEYISHAVGSIIHAYAQELDATMPAILAGHLTVSSGIFSGSEKRAIYGTDPILLPSRLAIAPFDYIALGHLHRYQQINPGSHPAIVYAGSIERVDFGERKEDKGFCLVTIESKEVTTHEFIKSPMRSFIQVELELAKQGNQTQQIIQRLKHYNLEGAIVKIVYHLPAGTIDHVDLQGVELACKSAMHVASIVPIHTHQSRASRSSIKTDMDFATLLEAYFDHKPELKERKKELIEKALALHQEAKTGTLEHD
jgi:DNA repair protein SbcD/Mre11